MDQLKPILAGMKQHRFWIISGIVFLAFMATWYLETSRLRTEADNLKSTYEQSFSTVSTVGGIQNHPNPNMEKGMDALQAKYYLDLEAAWRAQYEAQVALLKWPDMGKDFQDVVDRLKPIENTVAAQLTELEEPLTSDQRDRYRYFIQDFLPELAELVGAHWSPDGPAPKDKKILVDWKPGNQTAIRDSRFTWENSTPTTLEVLYAQEDMWVYTALLNVIKNVNGDIEGKYQAAIKEIDFLEIGPDAIGLAGSLQPLKGSATGAMGMDSGSGGMGMGIGAGGMGMDEEGAGSGAGPMGSGGTGSVTTTSVDPAENRYVDKEFKPLSAEKLRGAFDSENPEDAIYAVAKRIPVRMRFVMDQRKIPRLLAECANYEMQIEIRQVRVNCPSGSTFRGGGFGGGGGGMGGLMGEGGMGMDGMGGMGGMGMGEGGMGMDGMGGTDGRVGNAPLKLKDSSPWDVTVELYGIVMLYNPVEISKIKSKLKLPEPEPADAGDPVPTEAG